MTLETEAAPAAAPDLAISEVSPEAEAAPPDTSSDIAMEDDADLRAVFRKNNPDRDHTGRFRGRDNPDTDPEPETEVLQDQPPTEKPEQAVKPAIQPPQSWSADVKAKWEALPPDVQEFVSKREREAHEAITRQGQALKAIEPVRTVIDQYQDVFRRHNVTVEDGINRLLAVEKSLLRDPVSTIAAIAQSYGVDLNQFAQGQPNAGSADPQVSQLHQRIQWLESQLNETSTRINQREQAEANQQAKSMQSLIEKFSSDKSDWSDLESDVLAELVGINAAITEGIVQPMTAEDKLSKAYDRAIRNNPDAWARKQDAERKAEEAKRVEEARKRTDDAKRAKSVNVTSSPAKGSAPRSMDDTLKDAWRAAQAKG